MSKIVSAHRPIGVFDSGLGGLTVLRALRQQFPQQDFLYLGDTARVPYGTKSPETVSQYAQNAAQFLIDQGCGAIVIACNTASAYAASRLRDTLRVPVIDVIAPLAQHIAEASYERVLILGTSGTVRSCAYPHAIHAHAPHTQTTQQACGLFVSLVEEGWTKGPIVQAIATRYLTEAFTQGIPDLIVLGCTHYPILRDVITQVAHEIGAPEKLEIIDSSGPAAAALADACHWIDRRQETLRGMGETTPAHARDQQPTEATTGTCTYLVTDAPLHFASLAEQFLGERIENAHHVDFPPPRSATLESRP